MLSVSVCVCVCVSPKPLYSLIIKGMCCTKPVYCTSVYKTSLLINNVHKTSLLYKCIQNQCTHYLLNQFGHLSNVPSLYICLCLMTMTTFVRVFFSIPLKEQILPANSNIYHFHFFIFFLAAKKQLQKCKCYCVCLCVCPCVPKTEYYQGQAV